MAEDYMTVPPEGPPITGRANVMAPVAGPFEQHTSVQTATVDEMAAFGDHGVSWGTWQEALTPKAAGADVVAHGKWMVVCSWKAWRHIYNVAQSPPPAGN